MPLVSSDLDTNTHTLCQSAQWGEGRGSHPGLPWSGDLDAGLQGAPWKLWAARLCGVWAALVLEARWRLCPGSDLLPLLEGLCVCMCSHQAGRDPAWNTPAFQGLSGELPAQWLRTQGWACARDPVRTVIN